MLISGEFLADIAKARKPPMTPQAYYNRFKALGLDNIAPVDMGEDDGDS